MAKECLKETHPQTINQAADDEETKAKQAKPIIRTPKLSRKTTLDILREEEEKDYACKDDPEILSITRKAILANRFPSNTNLLTPAHTPVPYDRSETGSNMKTR